jgi:hypothetical protein
MLRFSERDLLMRYHWGLGVGHLYTRQPSGTSAYISKGPSTYDVNSPEPSPRDVEPPEPTHDADLPELPTADIESPEQEWRLGENNVDTQIQDRNSGDSDDNDDELGFEDREHVGWDNVETEESEGEGENDAEDMSEEDFTGM